jgi:hypothetical protein
MNHNARILIGYMGAIVLAGALSVPIRQALHGPNVWRQRQIDRANKVEAYLLPGSPPTCVRSDSVTSGRTICLPLKP